MLSKWEDLPETMKNEEVRKYYEILSKRRLSLFFKRAFDIVASLLLLIILSPLFVIVAIAIKLDSKGPVFYRQERVTRNMRTFRIHKFRSMTVGADKGSQITVGDDKRITRVGRFIRKCRLDEISQLIDVLLGDMTFVGTRPEVRKFVDCYAPEMLATLLLPAGVTSEASICFSEESELLSGVEDTDGCYVREILPKKMEYNLRSIEKFSLLFELGVMFRTALLVFGIGKKKRVKSQNGLENGVDKDDLDKAEKVTDGKNACADHCNNAAESDKKEGDGEAKKV